LPLIVVSLIGECIEGNMEKTEAQALRITLQTTYHCTKWVNGVAFSPDSRLLAAACGGSLNPFSFSDDAVWIWNTGQKLVNKLTGHKAGVSSVAFSPDGQWIASGSRDETVRIWRVKDGVCTQILAADEPTAMVHSVAFSPDGQWLATCNGQRPIVESTIPTVRIWSVKDGTCAQTLTGHSSIINSIAFSPDGQWLASGSNDDTVRIWSAEDGTCIRTLASTSTVKSVAFSPDGQSLAFGSDDGLMSVWKWGDDNRNLPPIGKSPKPEDTIGVSSLAFSSDSQWLAVGSFGGVLEILRANDGTNAQTLTGHSSVINSIAFSPDGQWLASGSNDKTVRLWKINQT
jgi:WD40 repeat protein